MRRLTEEEIDQGLSSKSVSTRSEVVRYFEYFGELQDIEKLVQGSGLICRSSPPPDVDLMLLELPQGLLNLIQSHRA